MTTPIVSARLLAAQVTSGTVWTFLGLTDAEGRVGWGECTLGRAAAQVTAAAAARLPGLVGTSPSTLEAPIVPPDLPQAAVVSAIAQACCDLAAQCDGRPLAHALGGPRRDDVGLYANVNRRTRDRRPASMAESARLAVSVGYDACKIAPFDEMRPDLDGTDRRRALDAGLARVAAVRDAAGPDARLMVDCHWRFSTEGAREMIAACAPLSPWWIECPVAETEDRIPDIRMLRDDTDRLGVRLAGLEELAGLDAFRPYAEAGAYDVMMPDIKYAGGPREMLRIARWLDTRGVTVSPHNPSGPISHMHSVHLCAALPRADLLEHQFDETPRFADIVVPGPPPPVAGVVRLLSGVPGLGLAPDEAAFGFETLITTKRAAP